MKIHRAEIADMAPGNAVAGEITELDAKTGRLIVATGNGCLQLTELQPEAKRRMNVPEFLRGSRLNAGDVFASQ